MGGRSKAFPRLIGLTVFIQIFDGPQVRFETPVGEWALDSLGQKFAQLTLEMFLIRSR